MESILASSVSDLTVNDVPNRENITCDLLSEYWTELEKGGTPHCWVTWLRKLSYKFLQEGVLTGMRNNTNKGRGKKIHVSVYKGSIAAIRNLSRTEEPAKAGTCARDRRALQQLALNVHIKHSDLTCYSK